MFHVEQRRRAMVVERMTQQLVKYDAMCAAIAAAHQVDEIKDIRDQARMTEAAAKIAGNTEAEDRCYEIRRRAEKRLGQIIAEQKRNGHMATGTAGLGRPKKGGVSATPPNGPPALA